MNWRPNPKDIEALCDAITNEYIREDSRSCDYCIYCGKKYGNHYLRIIKNGEKETHEADCPVLIARDVMTGFPH